MKMIRKNHQLQLSTTQQTAFGAANLRLTARESISLYYHPSHQSLRHADTLRTMCEEGLGNMLPYARAKSATEMEAIERSKMGFRVLVKLTRQIIGEANRHKSK